MYFFCNYISWIIDGYMYSYVWFRVKLNIFLLLRFSSLLSFAVSMDQSVTWRGGRATWATAGPPLYHRPGIHPNFRMYHPWSSPTEASIYVSPAMSACRLRVILPGRIHHVDPHFKCFTQTSILTIIHVKRCVCANRHTRTYNA